MLYRKGAGEQCIVIMFPKHPDLHRARTRCLDFDIGPIHIFHNQLLLIQKHYFHKSLVKTNIYNVYDRTTIPKWKVNFFSLFGHVGGFPGSLYEDTQGENTLVFRFGPGQSHHALMSLHQEKIARHILLSILTYENSAYTRWILSHNTGYITWSYIILRLLSPRSTCVWCTNENQFEFWNKQREVLQPDENNYLLNLSISIKRRTNVERPMDTYAQVGSIIVVGLIVPLTSHMKIHTIQIC